MREDIHRLFSKCYQILLFIVAETLLLGSMSICFSDSNKLYRHYSLICFSSVRA